jgi:hypothetical protein
MKSEIPGQRVVEMRVIFLDIDGVLISERCFWQMRLCHYQTIFPDRQALKALRMLVDKTGAKIVITSSWRNLPGEAPSRPYLQLQSRLAHNRTPVYDQTPLLELEGKNRGDEIAAWLEAHSVEWFVVVDDNDRFGEHDELRKRWVKVDSRYGLRVEDVEKVEV